MNREISFFKHISRVRLFKLSLHLTNYGSSYSTQNAKLVKCIRNKHYSCRRSILVPSITQGRLNIFLLEYYIKPLLLSVNLGFICIHVCHLILHANHPTISVGQNEKISFNFTVSFVEFKSRIAWHLSADV